MILWIYLALIAASLTLFILGMQNGVYGSKVAVQDESTNRIRYDSKLVLTLVYLGLAAVLFFSLGYSSFAIEQNYCEPQVNQTVLTGNTTVYTNSITCTTDYTVDEPVGWLWYSFGIFSLLMGVMFTVKFVSE